MKRVRLDTWVCQLQPPRNPRIPQQCAFSQAATRSTRPQTITLCHRSRDTASRRWASTGIASSAATKPAASAKGKKPRVRRVVDYKSDDQVKEPRYKRSIVAEPNTRIAKLSALHARLSLPAELPLQTLARCLIHKSADGHPERNNSSLAILGQDLLAYYTAEHLIVNYPRLPLPIVFAAQYAFNGPEVLYAMRAEWGVQLAAAPGHEVDRALLQFKRVVAGKALAADGISQVQDAAANVPSANTKALGMSGRVIHNDEFGEMRLDTKPYSGAQISQNASLGARISKKSLEEGEESETQAVAPTYTTALAPVAPVTASVASATFIRAVAGAIYLHAGNEAVKQFHREHFLSRHLQLHKLFHFNNPARDLNRLCQREGFERPIARLLSETGRHSRTPVFVVGIYSGEDKLGEAAGASLNEARVRAAAAALRSWYLYTPPLDNIMRPSSMEDAASAPETWLPQMVDPGEIVT